MERDPRNDPRAGDVLSKPGGNGPLRREVTSRSGYTVCYRRNGHRRSRSCWITSWQEWARGATVDQTAEEVQEAEGDD